MRNRILEILSALIGVAIVAALYIDRDWFGAGTSGHANPVPAVEPVVELPPAGPLTDPPVAVEVPRPSEAQVSELSVITPTLEEAESAWEAAREELNVVEAELQQLDLRFDEAEAEFADMEVQAEDPEQLQDQMLIRLDAIVEQYEALELRQVEVERAERIAAEALARAREAQP